MALYMFLLEQGSHVSTVRFQPTTAYCVTLLYGLVAFSCLVQVYSLDPDIL